MFPNHLYDPAAYQAWSQAMLGGKGSSSHQQEETPPSSSSARDNSAQFSKPRSEPFIQQKLINEFKKLPVVSQKHEIANTSSIRNNKVNTPSIRDEKVNTPSIRDETANTPSIRVGGRTIQHVKGGNDGNGGVVTCIAMVANISYEKARSAAIEIADFEPGGDGLDYKQAKAILEKFGVKSRRHVYKKINWSDLPDIALVSILDPRGEARAVVFARSDKGEFIFDRNKQGPVSRDGYKIDPEDAYLEILSPGHQPHMHQPHMDQPHMDQPHMHHPYMYEPPMHHPYMYGPPMHHQPMHHQPMHHQPMHHQHMYGPYGWHVPSHHHHHHQRAYPSETIGTRQISIVKAGDRDACVITCIAMVANVSFQTAQKVSLDYWAPGKGMYISDAKKALEQLGIKSKVYDQDSGISWSDLPDLAIIAVKGRSENHAVVFGRTKDGRELIFDCNKSEPVPCYRYTLLKKKYYVKIL